MQLLRSEVPPSLGRTPEDDRPSIAIIGGGLGGTLTAIRLLDNARAPLRIQIVEPRTELGRGLAFSTREPGHVMNGPAKQFSLYPERPEHFSHFLARYGRDWSWRDPLAPDYANAFAPRWVYGDYVRAELARAVAQAAPGVSFEHVTGLAEDLSVDGDQVRVTLKDGRRLSADHAVLALGVFQGEPAIPIDPAVRASGRYVRDPWDREAFESLPRTGRTLLIGAGLTMLDALISLERHGFRGRYLALSRRGLSVHPRREVTPWRDFLSEMPQTTAQGLLRAARAELAAAQHGRADWQSLVMAIRAHVPHLWQHAQEAERQRFLRHLRPIWEVSLHRAPPRSMQLLERGRAEGWFTSRAGRLQALEATHDGRALAHVTWRRASSPDTLHFDAVINCSGAQYAWTKITDRPLVANLLRRGLVRNGPASFGIDADLQGTPVGRDSALTPRLSAVGPPLRGVRWESSTIVELVAQTTSLAERLQFLLHGTRAFR